MFELSRTVRFASNHPDRTPTGTLPTPENGYAGAPGLRGLGRFEEVVVRCTGPLDPTLRYLIDIKEVDRAVRRTLAPAFAAAFLAAHRDPAAVLAAALPALAAELRGLLHSIRWNLTPFASLEARMDSPAVVFTQKFEFAASHRLHVSALSDEENRRAFGKCNHASGHGHNYIVELAVELPPAPGPGPRVDGAALTAGGLEAVARRAILDRYDHRYLNVDTPEFDESRGGVIPTVENIAREFFSRAAPLIPAPARLARITVWESERTAASFPATLR